MAKNKNVGKPRNYALQSGVYRFGKSKTYHKKAVYKFLKKTAPKKVRLYDNGELIFLFKCRNVKQNLELMLEILYNFLQGLEN